MIDLLNREVAKALDAPDARAQIESTGMDISLSTPQEFGAYIEAQMELWSRVVKDANIKLG